MEWRHHLLPNAYPVYSLGWERRTAELLAEMARVGNLDLLGRGGLFLYSHLHDQIRLGREYAARLAESPRAGR
jgi:protoporphyrinogen oxidase